ncbi:class C sortase [Vagococcus lutrae]|uniref:class C sortase n=1 Tax=Vagococcus lutrae TaxID=81947 RepID=UPI00200E9302|nr:class C sortase [Vagococcus lutrae]MDT2816597.1 class C sortase [Vagococcus lutrae]UQF22842.1 class C sortase [Vagococcus lutrae]UQF38182.1 class C sortase [Vagococcus lutrae]UQF63237.1 class C sortase [Vagococcus lutrae]
MATKPNKAVNHVLTATIVLLFITGAVIFFYPFIANAINTYYANQMVETVQKEANDQFLKEKKARLRKEKKAAQETAAKQVIGLTEDMFDVDESDYRPLSKEDYQKHLIGSVYIPKISVGLPLFDETTDDLLEQGATLLQGTSYPTGGYSTHSVITSHSGLPEKKLFTDLEKLKVGDYFLVNNLDKTMKYEIESIKEVLPTETDDLVIQEGKDMMTLLTCTPYMINTHRLLVTGHRVPYTEDEANKEISSVKKSQQKDYYLLLLIILIVFTFFIWWLRNRVLIKEDKRGYENEKRK